MKQEEKWNLMYLLLLEYYKEKGNVEVPESFIGANGEKLGIWVSTQRTRFKSNKLSEDRIEKLRLLGFRFDNMDFSKIWDAKWEYMYSLLEEYKKVYNNLEVPFKYITKSGDNLGTWVHTQRFMYKNNKLSFYKEDKLKLLGFRFESIGTDEIWDAKWEYMYNLLVEYKKEHNNTEVPRDYKTSRGDNLGTWVNRQRISFKNNSLSPNREEKLRLLDFRFDNIDLDARWNYMYSLLIKYKIRFGDTEVSKEYKTSSGENLGAWVNTQRRVHRFNKMSPDREEKLRLLGFRFYSTDKQIMDSEDNREAEEYKPLTRIRKR